MARQTPSQTIGPFFAYGLVPERYGHAGIASDQLAGEEAPGTPILLEGRVLDGVGEPVSDALLEFWQADADGYFIDAVLEAGQLNGHGFRGFARIATDANGTFALETIKPGAVASGGNRVSAPHIAITVFARGLLNHLFTRAYFDDEAELNGQDEVLACVAPERRMTITARVQPARRGRTVYRLDIRLSGDEETVFLDI